MKQKAFLIFIVISLLFTACQHKDPLALTPEPPEQQATEIPQGESLSISNLSDPNSQEEVAVALKKYLPEETVDQFIATVQDYNNTIQQTSLTQGFEAKVPKYDMDKISSLWKEAKGTFIGINCRITAFTLLKELLQIHGSNSDDALLFLDKDAISTGSLLTEKETEQFKQLFSRVKTEKTEDIQVHAQKMREHLSNFTFNKNTKMVSVVLHDNLDGDYLFIGHVGVLVESDGMFYFVEKLSFEEPYQVLKFSQEDDCYRHLLKRYEDFTGDGSAKPFIMVNGEFKLGQD